MEGVVGFCWTGRWVGPLARPLPPTLTHLAVQLASRISFRQPAEVVGAVLSQSVGAMTIHRLRQTVGAQQTAAEASPRAGVYEQGGAAQAGEDVADPLFIEADGVTISLPREPHRRTEIKTAMAPSARSAISVDKQGRVRRKVTGKVSDAGIEHTDPFWEGAWLTIGARNDLPQTTRVVVGGNGASWIRGGRTGATGAMFQLDRSHLARELKRVLGAHRHGGIPSGSRRGCGGAEKAARRELDRGQGRPTALGGVAAPRTRPGDQSGWPHGLSPQTPRWASGPWSPTSTSPLPTAGKSAG